MRVTQSWLAIGATQISVNRLLPGRVTSALAPARHRERDISQQHSLSSYSYCSASGGALRDKLIIQLGKFIAMWVTYRMLQAEADALRIGKFGWRIHAPLFLGGYNKRAPCQSMFTVTFCYMIHMKRMCGCAFLKACLQLHRQNLMLFLLPGGCTDTQCFAGGASSIEPVILWRIS